MTTSSWDKYVIHPSLREGKIWQMYKKSLDLFWKEDEIKLSEDLLDWPKMTDNERHFIERTIAFFVASDGIVNENLCLRFYGEIDRADVRCFYGSQIMIENIHSDVYSTILTTLVRDEAKRDLLFRAVENIPCIGKKAKWAHRWINDKESSFATRLVAFACVEGIFFSSSFASLEWLRKRGLMPGLTFSNELISRDEALHTDFAVLLYNSPDIVDPKTRMSEHQLHDLVREAAEIEIEFTVDALPSRLVGINAGQMTRYVQFVADRICVQLGYSKVFHAANPLDFMERQSMIAKANHFERHSSSYGLASREALSEHLVFGADAENIDF